MFALTSCSFVFVIRSYIRLHALSGVTFSSLPVLCVYQLIRTSGLLGSDLKSRVSDPVWLVVCVRTRAIDRGLIEICRDLIEICRVIISTNHNTENWSQCN